MRDRVYSINRGNLGLFLMYQQMRYNYTLSSAFDARLLLLLLRYCETERMPLEVNQHASSYHFCLDNN